MRNLDSVLDEFARDAHADVENRWLAWKLDLSKAEIHEVVGALLARQASLASELANTPSIWNPHVGPLILRAMADLHITLAWILMQPKDRCRKFILYGLGQMKRRIEQYKQALGEGEPSPDQRTRIQALEDWLNSQRWMFLTDVNLGNWAGSNTRRMAEEAACLDFYNSAYGIFSEAAHSMWHHVSIFNLKSCTNPLHGSHRIPIIPTFEPQIYYLQMAGKYLQMTLERFDEAVGVSIDTPGAYQKLLDNLGELVGRAEED